MYSNNSTCNNSSSTSQAHVMHPQKKTNQLSQVGRRRRKIRPSTRNDQSIDQSINVENRNVESINRDIISELTFSITMKF